MPVEIYPLMKKFDVYAFLREEGGGEAVGRRTRHKGFESLYFVVDVKYYSRMPSAEIQIVRTAVSLSPYGTAPMKTVPVFGGSHQDNLISP